MSLNEIPLVTTSTLNIPTFQLFKMVKSWSIEMLKLLWSGNVEIENVKSRNDFVGDYINVQPFNIATIQDAEQLKYWEDESAKQLRRWKSKYNEPEWFH